MHNFEYDIGINELGAPYIDLPENKKLSLEEKFMSLEVTRLIFIGIINDINNKKNRGKHTFTDKDINRIVNAYNVVNLMSDEVGLLYKATKEINDELSDFLNTENEDE